MIQALGQHSFCAVLGSTVFKACFARTEAKKKPRSWKIAPNRLQVFPTMGRLFFPLWVVQIQSNHICRGRMFFRIQSNLTLDELRRKTNSEPGQSTSEIISYTYLCYIFIGRISSPQETCLQSSPKEIFLQSLQKKTYLQSLELCEAFKEVAHRQNNSRKANLGASQSRSKQFSKDTFVFPWYSWNF